MIVDMQLILIGFVPANLVTAFDGGNQTRLFQFVNRP
jgi:hypothetical protein